MSHRVVTPILDPVLAVVDGDPVEPGRELRFLAKRVDLLEDRDEHFLGHVLGFMAVSEHPVADVVDPVAVGLDELAERPLVAVAQPPQERSLELRHTRRSAYRAPRKDTQPPVRVPLPPQNRIPSGFSMKPSVPSGLPRFTVCVLLLLVRPSLDRCSVGSQV